MIDPTAVIDPSAQIAADVTIGPFCRIGPQVEVQAGTVIGSHVVIHKNTRIGQHNKIYDFAALGGDPQDISPQQGESYLEIGDHNVIREFCTLNRGSAKGQGDATTRIGDHNMLMAYAHIAHDCLLGNHIVFANNASIAGHVEVHDYAILGAFTGVHQFVRVGSYSFLGRAGKVSRDILPYMLVVGNPGGPVGLNSIGLKRHGFKKDLIRALKTVYKLFYHRDLKLTEIRQTLVEMSEQHPEIKLIVDMMDNTRLGVGRPRLRHTTAKDQDSVGEAV